MADMFMETVLARLDAMDVELKKPRHDAAAVLGVNGHGVPTGAPGVRRGENSMSSRPFRLLNLFGLMAGKIKPEFAKVETEMTDGLRKAMSDTGTRQKDMDEDSFVVPMAPAMLPDRLVYTEACQSIMRSMFGGRDLDEMAWISRRVGGYGDVQRAALTGSHSYLDDSLGAAMVKPAEYLGIIPLMRNQSALDRLGVTTVPLPPQGKAVFSRQTSATAGYWITENTTITTSQLGTGQLMMEAKKLGIAAVVPNDLFKFAGEAADALLQGDIAKTAALTADYAALYGPGNGRPKGLTLYNGSNELYDYAAETAPAPTSLGTNGNSLLPEDGEAILGVIEDRNFDVDSGWKWLMRGSRFRSLSATRGDAVTGGDKKGPFVVNLTRGLEDGAPTRWSGFPVVRSAQVDASATKGSGTSLTQVFGGMWGEALLGMYGAMEFARSPGENAFLADQTIIRGIMYTDIGFRYPGAFAYYKQLLKRG